jgi:hypothetical protein
MEQIRDLNRSREPTPEDLRAYAERLSPVGQAKG